MSSSKTVADDASGVPRRASGRVRKQPDLYAAPVSSGKRKRNQLQNGDGVGEGQIPEDDVSDEAETSEDDHESDEEERRERNRRARNKAKNTEPRKPAQKKPKVNGSSLPFRSAAGAAVKRAPRKKKAPATLDMTDAEGLFAKVFASADNVEDIAGQWIQDFRVHESRALADVINFVLKCAGCNIKVVEEDIEDPDAVSNRLTDIQDEFQASEPTDYPLIAKGRAAVSFRETMSGFLATLIKSIAAADLLYENSALIENIQVWFSTLSSAANRAFRHTATVASLSVITALCHIGYEDSQEMAAKQRQAENEKKKARPNKSRVKDMEQRVEESSKVVEFLELQLRDWFDVVFIHRYRDVDPNIRRDCMAALGDWIITLPEVFFDGQHLRYLGWVLSDTAATTRAEVIKQLQRLYKEKSMIGGLKTFTERFRVRLVEIATSDAESNVRCRGIELLDLLRENGLLEPDDIDAVGRLLYDSDPKVRKCLASFFAENVVDLYNSKIDDLGGTESLEEALPVSGEGNFETPRVAWIKYKCLAEMMVAYDAHEALPNDARRSRADSTLTLQAGPTESRFTLAADVLCDEIQEIEDWEALSGYLLFDHSAKRSKRASDNMVSHFKKECALTDMEETVLLHVVSSSVKRAIIDLGNQAATAKAKSMKKQREQLNEDQEEAARHLAGLIPKLLRKFGDSPSTAAAVLKMESVLNLPSLQDLPQDSRGYVVLLDDIRKQFMSHGTDEVLAPATDAILHAKSYGELDDVAEEKLASLWEDVVNNLADLVNPKSVTLRGASDAEELLALNNNLLRIARLSQVSSSISPLEDTGFAKSKSKASSTEYQGAIDYVIALIQRAIPATGIVPDAEDAAIEDQISKHAAEATLRYMQWKFNQIKNIVTSAGDAEVPFAELEALATRRDTYFNNMFSVLQKRKAGDSICIDLTTFMLDLSTSAKVLKTIRPKPGASDAYEELAVDIHPSIVKSMMNVFSASEKNFARLGGKKLDEQHHSSEDAEMAVDADPLDDDPLSDEDSDSEQPNNNAAAGPITQDDDDEPHLSRKELRQRNALIAERKLCEITRSIILAVHAGVLDEPVTRRRLERNKPKLGPNFKELLAYLDIGKIAKSTKASGAGAAKSARPNGAAITTAAAPSRRKTHPKSNAIVADDDMEDEIEDDDEDDAAALRRRGLVDEQEDSNNEDEDAIVVEQGGGDGGNDDVAEGEEEEEESVLGD